MTILNSESVLAMESETVSSLFEGELKYKLTDGEIGWLNVIRGKYCIADYVDENTEENEENDLILTISDSYEMSKALDDDCDGWGKATMLSDDTALQSLFFCGYMESETEEDE